MVKRPAYVSNSSSKLKNASSPARKGIGYAESQGDWHTHYTMMQKKKNAFKKLNLSKSLERMKFQKPHEFPLLLNICSYGKSLPEAIP